MEVEDNGAGGRSSGLAVVAVSSAAVGVCPAVGAVSSAPVDAGLSCSADDVRAHSSGPAAADTPSVAQGDADQVAGAGATRSWA